MTHLLPILLANTPETIRQDPAQCSAGEASVSESVDGDVCAFPGEKPAGLLKGSHAGQGPNPVCRSSYSPAMTLLGPSLCPFLNGKLEAWPSEGMHGGRERTLLIPTSTGRQETHARGQWRVLLPPFCSTSWGLPGRNHAEHWSLLGLMRTLPRLHSCSLFLGICWTRVLASLRLGLLLPSGQCSLLVPSTKLGRVREGFQ